ncbi:DUF4435 domain-containing protein [Alloprevotella sp. OH1205_COT-284]|uniref:DUF4435 domain-containing protein n=1 Tax=Alloprevotella sp. OH1205_COT-284 TaxID=2491043 RepID=UPI000F5FF64C|nr:DUF4435 domain-containing protein [Alloprevotella sp. OH1205_COT-284]RRD79920.1 DUF4435 domain-containing protein [Alloprevotella sp. OH1205_COT-284]
MQKLSTRLNSAYISAANRLQGRRARRKIVVYVESYDDIFFWNDLLSEVETDEVGFEVILPSRDSLGRGKKIALSNRLGPDMIACVDADYDYLMQGATPTSHTVCTSPYVLHTGVYSIENLQCYAPTLQQVCVMAVLNDKQLFDFESFLAQFSEIVFPLLVWNVWAYKYGVFSQFSLSDFAHLVELRRINFAHPEITLDQLRHRVNKKINWLQHHFPQGRATYKPLRDDILSLGVTPSTAYLYMRGHDLFDLVVSPLLSTVCDALRRDREREISRLARHGVQKQNELAAYQNSIAPYDEMIRKHTAYHRAPQFKAIVERARALVAPASSSED